MEFTTEQKIVVEVAGVTAAGKPAILDGGVLTFASSDEAVGVIAEQAGATARLVGVGAGTCAVVVTFTQGDLVLTATSEPVTVTAAGVVAITVTLGAVENQ